MTSLKICNIGVYYLINLEFFDPIWDFWVTANVQRMVCMIYVTSMDIRIVHISSSPNKLYDCILLGFLKFKPHIFSPNKTWHFEGQTGFFSFLIDHLHCKVISSEEISPKREICISNSNDTYYNTQLSAAKRFLWFSCAFWKSDKLQNIELDKTTLNITAAFKTQQTKYSNLELNTTSNFTNTHIQNSA